MLLIGCRFYQCDVSARATAYNGGCLRESAGERCGIRDVKHFSTTVSPSLFDNRGLTAGGGPSLLMKAYLPETEHTLPTHGEDTLLTHHEAQQEHPITVKTRGLCLL